VRASPLEYRLRLWILVAIFGLGLSLRRGPRVVDGVAGLFDLDAASGLRVTLFVAAFVAAVAASLRVWGAAYLLSDVVQDHALRTESLVADGPYRHVRNPLYLAVIVYAAAIGMLGTITGWWVLVLAVIVFLYRLVGHEERALVEAQDRDYVAYCAAVPRLWPSLAPRLPPSARRPRWGQAIRGELFMIGGVVACVAGGVTRSVPVAWGALGASFVVGLGARVLARRSRVKPPLSPSGDP
jgi:protein-S-isoprenylcysteine O-methyltransferase Ste14